VGCANAPRCKLYTGDAVLKQALYCSCLADTDSLRTCHTGVGRLCGCSAFSRGGFALAIRYYTQALRLCGDGESYSSEVAAQLRSNRAIALLKLNQVCGKQSLASTPPAAHCVANKHH